METPREVRPGIHILPSHLPLPGFGVLPINAFVIKAQEPVLIDTGLKVDAPAFESALESVIDPEDLKWLWLTHPDQDHVGSLVSLLDRVPGMRLITTYLGYGILSLFTDIPLSRVYFLNPGESLDVGDRTLSAIRPPTFDNPATVALFDSTSRVFFSSDSFGGLLEAPVEDARDLSDDALFRGQVTWTTVDSPWLHKVNESMFASELDSIRRMEPEMVLSSHLPPAPAMMDKMLKSLAAAPAAQPFVGPNQAALEAMLAQVVGSPA
jgi:flavorubredoxin